MMMMIIFLIWFYHVPELQGLDEDQIENSRTITAHQEEISFNSGKDSFLRLQQKYDHH